MVTVQTVRVRIAGVEADPCRIALPLEITHGRADVTNQPDPSSATVLWDGPDCAWKIGDTLDIWSGAQYEPAVYDSDTVYYDDSRAVYDSSATGEVLRARFTGYIAGLTAQGRLGVVTGWTLDAVGSLARLGTRVVKLTRPAERDTTRVQAIGTAVGIPVTIKGAAGVLLAAGDVEGDALSALHTICESTGGLLYQNTDGTIVYGTAKHRTANSAPIGVIPCEALDSELSWMSDVEDIINEVVVAFGTDETPGEVTHRDTASIAKPWGVRSVSVSTVCAYEADADELAVLILARRAWPYYGVTNGLIAVPALDADASRLFHSIEVSSPVLIPIPNEPGPTPSDYAAVVVEGWVETWTEGGDHLAQAAFSDQHRWALTTLRDYAEVLAGGDYGYWLNNGDYLDMLIKEA